jgi:S1-C subfamily serine protease
MTELIEHGAVTWGSIGDIVWFTIDRDIAARNDLDVTGAYVRSISSASPAYRAGLEPGDIVTTLNGQHITDADQIDRVVVRQKVGSTIALGVRKRNGRMVTIDVPIAARQSQTFRRRTYGLRLTAYGLRLTAYGLRLTAYGLRLTASDDNAARSL